MGAVKSFPISKEPTPLWDMKKHTITSYTETTGTNWGFLEKDDVLSYNPVLSASVFGQK